MGDEVGSSPPHPLGRTLPPLPAYRADKKPRGMAVLLALIGALVGGIGGFAGMRLAMADESTARPLVLVVMGVAFLLGAWSAMLAHELGHAAAAKLIGRPIYVISIGSWWWVRVAGRWQFRRHRLSKHVGGLVVAADDSPDTPRWRDAVFVVGGCVVNLTGGALLMAIGVALVTNPLVDVAIISTAVIWLLIGSINLIPMRIGSDVRTDGHWLMLLLVGSEKSRRYASSIKALLGLALAGVRPRDLPARIVEAVHDSGVTPEERAMASSVRFARALDRQQYAEMMAAVDEQVPLLGAISAARRGPLAADIAFATARYRHDPATARQYLELATGPHVEGYSKLLIEAAIEWAEGKPDRARSLALAAKDAWQRPNFYAAPEVLDEIDKLLGDCQPTASSG